MGGGCRGEQGERGGEQGERGENHGPRITGQIA